MTKLHKRILISVFMTVATIVCEHLLERVDQSDDEDGERAQIGFR